MATSSYLNATGSGNTMVLRGMEDPGIGSATALWGVDSKGAEVVSDGPDRELRCVIVCLGTGSSSVSRWVW